MKQRILFFTLALLPVLGHAQRYSIDWFTIDGGGGASAGAGYSLIGTIGQPDAGILAGGIYSLAGGFWGGVTPAQTVSAPLLIIEWTDGAVRIFWPLPGTGFVLDEALVLTGSPTNGWDPVAFPYATNATQISITVPMPTGNRFFRLRGP